MVLYFSATGNSEYAAKVIAQHLGDEAVSLTPLMKARDFSKIVSEKPWVVVSPIYVEDMADIVRDFLKHKELSGSRQIYFVYTTGSTFGTADYTSRLLCDYKGMEYMGSAVVVMPTNYILVFPAKDDETNAERIRAVKPRMRELAGMIEKREPFPVKKVAVWAGKFFDGVDRLFRKKFIRTELFYTTDACISCGKCERLCPLNNIRIRDRKPVWGGHCTHCMACVSGCPTESIEYGKTMIGKRRYHFPKELLEEK